tara:strand:+ start:287 stop:493 length:207 start_codon:yes stop_codon:yes gene_type:complete
MSIQVTLTKSELFMITSSLQYLSRTSELRIAEEYGAIAPLYNKLVSLQEIGTVDDLSTTRHGGDMDAL